MVQLIQLPPRHGNESAGSVRLAAFVSLPWKTSAVPESRNDTIIEGDRHEDTITLSVMDQCTLCNVLKPVVDRYRQAMAERVSRIVRGSPFILPSLHPRTQPHPPEPARLALARIRRHLGCSRRRVRDAIENARCRRVAIRIVQKTALDDLSRHLGARIRWLIGSDVLGRWPVRVDPVAGTVSFAAGPAGGIDEGLEIDLGVSSSHSSGPTTASPL